MIHLIESKHNDRFIKILNKYYPFWRDARSELNKLPLAAENFKKN
jgi:predicted metal-dependent hydrolase